MNKSLHSENTTILKLKNPSQSSEGFFYLEYLMGKEDSNHDMDSGIGYRGKSGLMSR